MPFSLPNYNDPSTGSPVTFFVITSMAADLIHNQISVSVNGYYNQAAYTNGLQPNSAPQDYMINGDLYNKFLAIATVNDLPVGSTQQQLLTELIGVLHQAMVQNIPFFAQATIV